jgi:hypothetical protein
MSKPPLKVGSAAPNTASLRLDTPKELCVPGREAGAVVPARELIGLEYVEEADMSPAGPANEGNGSLFADGAWLLLVSTQS